MTWFRTNNSRNSYKTMALKNDIARFMSKVDKLPNGCWFWTGARSRGRGNKKWYGSFHFRGRVIRAHVFAHDILAKKHCPQGYHRDHTCHFSMCVNPDHLEAVPSQVNNHRRRPRYEKHESTAN